MKLCVTRSVLALTTVMMLAGCGSPAEAVDAGAGASAAAGATTAKKGITLEPGWRMQDVITAEEVGAITGKAMDYFPEANASAKNGRPAAGFTVPGTPYSKIGFSAFIDYGEKEYELLKKYAVDGTLEDVPGVGDKAYVFDLEDGSRAFVVLLGETVIRISWTAKTWEEFDRVELGSRLANKLIDNITK